MAKQTNKPSHFVGNAEILVDDGPDDKGDMYVAVRYKVMANGKPVVNEVLPSGLATVGALTSGAFDRQRFTLVDGLPDVQINGFIGWSTDPRKAASPAPAPAKGKNGTDPAVSRAQVWRQIFNEWLSAGFTRQEATALANEATGMSLSVPGGAAS